MISIRMRVFCLTFRESGVASRQMCYGTLHGNVRGKTDRGEHLIWRGVTHLSCRLSWPRQKGDGNRRRQIMLPSVMHLCIAPSGRCTKDILGPIRSRRGAVCHLGGAEGLLDNDIIKHRA